MSRAEAASPSACMSTHALVFCCLYTHPLLTKGSPCDGMVDITDLKSVEPVLALAGSSPAMGVDQSTVTATSLVCKHQCIWLTGLRDSALCQGNA
jgi:hypothetical protein